MNMEMKNISWIILGLCDFQYLPIVSEENSFESEGEIVYNKICPKKIPSLEWFS